MFYGKFKEDDAHRFQETIRYYQTVFSRVYADDQLITFDKNLSFIDDPRFIEAFKRQARTDQERSLAWRLHTLCWAARHCMHISGDFVECGVWHGFSFAVITDYLNFETLDKQLYLYDTYEGIPQEYNSEKRSMEVYEREGDIYPEVKARFAKYPNVQVVKGLVPASFQTVAPDKVSLLHVDMNSSKSEIEALHGMFDRVSPGGIIILDDYGWLNYRNQKRVEDQFMAERGYQILEIPTGQGIVFKR